VDGDDQSGALSDWKQEVANSEPRVVARTHHRPARPRELPLPADADERRHLVTAPGWIFSALRCPLRKFAAFVSDHEPTALDSLAKRLAHRPGITPLSGLLTSGPTKFRAPRRPRPAKKPRTASNPGQYTLGWKRRLVVVRRPAGERLVNEAHIRSLLPTRPACAARAARNQAPRRLRHLAAAWMRGGTVLWVQQKKRHPQLRLHQPAQVKKRPSKNQPSSKSAQAHPRRPACRARRARRAEAGAGNAEAGAADAEIGGRRGKTGGTLRIADRTESTNPAATRAQPVGER